MHPPASITCDDSLWPLLAIRLEGAPSVQHYEQYLAHLTGYLRRREKHVCLIHTAQRGMPSPKQRKRHALWLKAHEELIRETVLGIAFIVTAPSIQLMMSVIFHGQPLPSPYLLTAHLDEAVAWAAERLHEAGLSVPARRVRSHYGLCLHECTG